MSDSDHRRVPTTIAGLARDKHHRYVPWFVDTSTGEPDFRVIRRGGIGDAVRQELCWVCGTHRGREAAFVIGPMCAINRISAEPPSHRECARYSADVCPFLTTPTMNRRERGLPDDRIAPAGKAIWRNPGVALVWYSRRWKLVFDPQGAPLFDVGEPSRVYWRCQGREATRESSPRSNQASRPCSSRPKRTAAAPSRRSSVSTLPRLNYCRAHERRLGRLLGVVRHMLALRSERWPAVPLRAVPAQDVLESAPPEEEDPAMTGPNGRVGPQWT